jgi:hypothetical protein
MVVLRCTARLLRHVPLPVEDSPDGSTSALADWYANALFVGTSRLVLCVAERSLLSVIVPLREGRSLPERWAAAVGDRLRRLDVPPAAVAAELEMMHPIHVARTASRSVLGSMNDFAFHCRWYITERGVSDLRDLEDMLSETPCAPLRYQYPREVAARLLETASARQSL